MKQFEFVNRLVILCEMLNKQLTSLITLWEKQISSFSISNRISTPFENPIASISFIAHIAVISAVPPYLEKSFPIVFIKPPLF